ncbi:MAG: hypothetical protein DME75_04300, partial [Verrucomicrobia bacterium]
RKSNESPFVMTGPLIALAVLATLGGFAFFARNFVALPIEKEVGALVPVLAIGVLILGSGLAIAFYRNRTSEPFDIALLRHKFYFDDLYAWLIDWTQELLARIAAFFDRWIILFASIRVIRGRKLFRSEQMARQTILTKVFR